MTEHQRVFADPDGRHYIACFGEDRRWLRWAAVEHGWRERTRLRGDPFGDPCELGCARCDERAVRALPPDLARLALRLSGVEGG